MEKNKKQTVIILACDTHEGGAFRFWLEKQGYDASIGSSTGNYIDGVWTATDEDANRKMNQLWDEYCSSS